MTPTRSYLIAGLMACTSLISAQALAQEWSGPYVGAHIGAGSAAENKGETLIFDTDLDGNYGDTVRTGAGADAFAPGYCDGAATGNNAAAGCEDDDDKGTDFGARLGYDWQYDQMVYGLVLDVSSVDVEDHVTGFSSTPAAYQFSRKSGTMAAVRGRAGYATQNNWLLYGTAGLATADLERSFTTTNGANSFTPVNEDDRASGYQVGVGAEKRLDSNWSLGVEYLYTSLNDDDYTVEVGPGTAPDTNPFLLANSNGTDMRRSEDKFAIHSVRVTASYRFGM